MDATPTRDPDEIWAHLLRGNQRFAAGAQMHPRARPERREFLVDGQSPIAAVLGCSDSRVPPELIFDQGLGDLFVVRTGGEVADDVVLGSLEFAVTALRAPLLVVLGHTSCGAIRFAAAVAHGETTAVEHLRDIVSHVSAAVTEAAAEDAIAQHVRDVVDFIAEQSHTIADALAEGSLAIVGAVYSLETGLVSEVCRADRTVTPAP